jgi:hypothetical protein
MAIVFVAAAAVVDAAREVAVKLPIVLEIVIARLAGAA